MLLLGIDVGTSSIKVSVVDAQSQKIIASAQYPESEREIIAFQTGWAEQNPDTWWEDVVQAVLKCNSTGAYNSKDIAAIGIAYQMHGLVLTDKDKNILRNAIIWCDSRAVEIGNTAFKKIGADKCLPHLLNSPGNFTAAKLAWVKNNEPRLYNSIDKLMLPGDYIALKLTGAITTSAAALSEGVFWDFKNETLSADVLNYFEFPPSFFPEIKQVFDEHGYVTDEVARQLELKPGIPVTYKAGDQPNNALSLNVLQPGEVAATAGTSGVIYAVSDALTYDRASRINTFAHVNYRKNQIRTGVLLNINGCGIYNRWIKNNTSEIITYKQMNEAAGTVPAGSDGLLTLPFGNGAERMLENKIINAQLHNINVNKHSAAHLYRSAQEGIVFALRYGFDIMKENGINPSVIRAGKANMFLSSLFTGIFADTINVTVEFYDGDGSFGAALGAGIGAGIYSSDAEALSMRKPVERIEPSGNVIYAEIYETWKAILEKQLV